MNDEMIRFACPSCGKRLKARAPMAGRSAPCTCGHTVRVPAARRRTPWRPGLPWVGGAVLLLVALIGTGAWVVRSPRQPAPPAPAPPAAVESVAVAPPSDPKPSPPADWAVAPAPVAVAPAVVVPVAAPATPDVKEDTRVAGAPPPREVPPPVPRDPKAVLEDVKRAVVLVEGKYGHGSGFLVAPDLVVTNSHVIRCEVMENVTVRFTTDGIPDDKGVAVRLLYEDKVRDLAVLRLEKPQDRPPLPLAKDFDPAGRPAVFVFGNPGQGEAGRALANVVEPAQCAADVQLLGGKPFYRLAYAAASGDVRIGHGNSGGPAVSTRGEVVGVLTRADFWADGRPVGKAYCIPAGSVRVALDGLGDPVGWARHADLAAGLHARDIATISAYANALEAAAAIDARYRLRQPARQQQGGPQRATPLTDKQLVRAYRELDDRFLETARPAARVAYASRELTADQKKHMTALRQELVELRRLALLLRVPPQGVAWARESEERCRKRFDDFCKDSGMDKECIRLMVTDIQRQAGVDVDE